MKTVAATLGWLCGPGRFPKGGLASPRDIWGSWPHSSRVLGVHSGAGRPPPKIPPRRIVRRRPMTMLGCVSSRQQDNRFFCKCARRRGGKPILVDVACRKRLITMLGWNIQNTAKTCVFENVRSVKARSPFGGLAVALPHLATPNHEGGLYTLGVRCRTASACLWGVPAPPLVQSNPLRS